ncbi:hypothetical protein Hanom_Chr08g00751211 [Helianthus anomalus]
MPLLFRYSGVIEAEVSIVKMSRASSIVMLLAYAAYIIFQLKTNTQVQEVDNILRYATKSCVSTFT